MATAITKRSARGDLAKYDPDKGLKSIAVAEAAEKHYARAKDPEKLYQAIEAKLTAQADFVAWWDTAAKKSTGAKGIGKKVPSQIADGTLRAGENGLPVRRIIERWRHKLADPNKFDTALEQAKAKCLQLVEAQKGEAHVSNNSGENEWYTPEEIIEAARLVLGGIDLDPATSKAANDKFIRAAQIFTLADNGLKHPWHGRVWMNPPYSQPAVEQFCEKLAASVKAGNVTAAVVLVNNATETGWFRSLADVASAICFPTGRVRFWCPGKDSATPLQGQAVLYVGPEAARFCEVFQPFGFLTQLVRVEVR